MGFRLELPLGSTGKLSGRGIWQLSPLKYILRGKAQPFPRVNDSMSFFSSISVVTEPS